MKFTVGGVSLAFIALAAVANANPPPVPVASGTYRYFLSGDLGIASDSGSFGDATGITSFGASDSISGADVYDHVGLTPAPFADAVVHNSDPYGQSAATTTLSYTYRYTANSVAAFQSLNAYLIANEQPNGWGPGVDIHGDVYLFATDGSGASADVMAATSLGPSFNAYVGCTGTDVTACHVHTFALLGGLKGDGATLSFSGRLTLTADVGVRPGGETYPGLADEAEADIDPVISLDTAFGGDPSNYTLALSPGLVNATVPFGGVPEPSAWALMALGVAGAGAAFRRAARGDGASGGVAA